MGGKPALTPRKAGGINQPCYMIHNVVRAPGGNAAPADRRGEVARELAIEVHVRVGGLVQAQR